jgi:glycerophosphoryl diester phosphodiesterase
VDELRDVEYVLDLGVDTIITDNPAEVRQLLDER